MAEALRVRLELVQALRDAVREYLVEQRHALQAVRGETEKARAFLDRAENAWRLRHDDAVHHLEHCRHEARAAAMEGGWIDCSSWEREVESTAERLREVHYWQQQIDIAESEFRPAAARVERAVDGNDALAPRAERFLSRLLPALQRALHLRIHPR